MLIISFKSGLVEGFPIFGKLLFFLLLVVSGAGCSQSGKYNPDNYFDQGTQKEIIRQCVLYSSKLPPNATHFTKFDSSYNWYYEKAAAECDLRRVAKAPDESYYFLMTRKARSIWPAREAIGGLLKVNKDSKLEEYQEIFRTWKMAEDSLNDRAFKLFDLMVKGRDLTPYYAKSKGDRYIEFPDDRFSFDKKDRRWKDRAIE